MKRIISNYSRLLTTFLAGLAILRIMGEIGHSALVLYLLLIAGTGAAFILKTVLRDSVIPVLGLTYDGAGRERFEDVYWVSFVSGLVSAAFALCVFAGLWWISDFFQLGALGETAVAVAFASCAVQVASSAVATPFLNAVLIDQRVIAYNMILALERLIELLAALVAWLWPGDLVLDARVILFYALAGAGLIVLQATVYLFATRANPRFRLSRTALTRERTKWIGAIMGWNLAIVIGFLLYARLPTLFVNTGLGAGETLTIGLVLSLIGYQRQVSMGLVIGLDAAVSRHYGAEDGPEEARARRLVLRSTYVQTVFSAVTTAALWIFIEPILRLWMGDSLDGSGWDLSLSVLLFQIMSAGMLARAMSEAWMKFFSGKGAVGIFAPWILAGGALYGLICVLAVFQGSEPLLMMAVGYAILNLGLHLLLLGYLIVRALHIAVVPFVGVLLMPLLLALVAAGMALWTLEVSTSAGASAALGLLVLAGLLSLPGLRWIERLPDRLA